MTTSLRAMTMAPKEITDVAIRYEITRVDCAKGAALSSPIVEVQPFSTKTLPDNVPMSQGPLAFDSEHKFADLLEVVQPGCFDVRATPIGLDDKPSTTCAGALKRGIRVKAGETTEIYLISQCQGHDRGTVDAVAALNHPPVIDDVRFEDDSKFICGSTGNVCIKAHDPDGDPMEFTLSFDLGVQCDVTPLAPALVPVTEQCFQLHCGLKQRALLTAKVYDQVIQASGVGFVRIEQWLADEGYPHDSHAELQFPAYFQGVYVFDPYGEQQTLVCEAPSPEHLASFVTGLEQTNANRPGDKGEVEVAVSGDGRHVVIATNGNEYAFNQRDLFVSHDFGRTYAYHADAPTPTTTNSDPTVAWGPSGRFYVGYVSFNGFSDENGVPFSSVAVSSSTDAGDTFTHVGHALATTVPPEVNGVDQPHMAADRFNQSQGEDQLYLAARLPQHITCSKDSGRTWREPVSIAGDMPRPAVGRDGKVYVVTRSEDNVFVERFSSCADGFLREVGPVLVARAPRIDSRTIPGMTRRSQVGIGIPDGDAMIAADDQLPKHVVVVFARNTAPGAAGTDQGNEDVVIKDSLDGGVTWDRPERVVNSPLPGRRMEPWICATGGDAFITWYDFRASVGLPGGRNDLMDFFGRRAFLDENARLLLGPELRLSQASDPLCAKWPGGTDSGGTFAACSVHPLAGLCGGSRIAAGLPNVNCDLDQPTCEIDGQSYACILADVTPFPKVGDYNGVGCGAGRLVAAWTSGTAGPGQPQPLATAMDFFASNVRALPARLEAESFDGQAGVAADTTGATFQGDGSYLAFGNVDFGTPASPPIQTLSARFGSAPAGSRLELRLDAVDGALAATLTLPSSSGAVMQDVRGYHDVFFVFRSNGGGARFDWFRLEEDPGRSQGVAAATP